MKDGRGRRQCALHLVDTPEPQLGKLLAFLLVFALLICNTAAGFASRLARGLAFAASAVLCALAEVAGFKSFDMLHRFTLRLDFNDHG